jgi:hypothetical protein
VKSGSTKDSTRELPVSAEDKSFKNAILIRLFRLWALAREDGNVGLGPMHSLARHLQLADETAPACASLFQLIEAELERPLVRECCCAKTFSPDELALLGVIEAAPSLDSIKGSGDVPHGLPGAIHWAAMTVRRSLKWPAAGSSSITTNGKGKICPFLSRELEAGTG